MFHPSQCTLGIQRGGSCSTSKVRPWQPSSPVVYPAVWSVSHSRKPPHKMSCPAKSCRLYMLICVPFQAGEPRMVCVQLCLAQTDAVQSLIPLRGARVSRRRLRPHPFTVPQFVSMPSIRLCYWADEGTGTPPLHLTIVVATCLCNNGHPLYKLCVRVSEMAECLPRLGRDVKGCDPDHTWRNWGKPVNPSRDRVIKRVRLTVWPHRNNGAGRNV
jgi:hypothetical protein